MVRNFILITLLFLYSGVNAQNLHFTIFAGNANYQGDLQEKRYTFSQAKFAYGFGFKYELTDKLYARANVTFCKIGADDKYATKPDIRDRNLNFTSSLTDIHLGIEYDLFNIYNTKFTPYLFVGVSGYHFNPYTYDTFGVKALLQPLGTEGQGFYQGRKKYSLNQFAIPFGGGIKFAPSDNVRLGIEIGLRKLTTDYLDDVSTTYVGKDELLANNGPKAVELAYREDELKRINTYPNEGAIRGNPRSLDWYYFTGLTMSIRIGSLFSSGGGRHEKYGCPTNIY